jgi:DNA-binding transcriptional MerR regulator
MTVSEVASRAGLTPRAVRFYETQGLLPRPQRTESGYRLYSEFELEQLQLVARLRAIGLGLADIREIVRMREHGLPPPTRIISLLHAKISQLNRDMLVLEERWGTLTEVLHRMQKEHARLCRVVGEDA